MRYSKIINIVFLAFIFFSLSACTKELPPGNYDAADVGRVNKVVPGVILSKRPVAIHNREAEDADKAEPVSVSSPPAENYNNAMGRSHGFEYVVRLASGTIISLVQTEDLHLKVKSHVLVIYGSNVRIVPDDGDDDY